MANIAAMLTRPFDNNPITLLLRHGKSSGIAVESPKDVQNIVRSGLAKKMLSIGDQMAYSKGGQMLVCNIIGIDHDTPTDTRYAHSLTLQLQGCVAMLEYDEREALYHCAETLEAGTYHFTLPSGYDIEHGGGKTLQFTLTQPVPANGILMFPWLSNVQATQTMLSSYTDVTLYGGIETVSVTEGNEGTFLGIADGTCAQMNHIERARNGSNDWKTSALRQLLNSADRNMSTVWTPQTAFDCRPNWAHWAWPSNGFLYQMDEEFCSVLGEVNKETALPEFAGGGSVVTSDKVFLLSRTEVYGGSENGIDEGDPYPFYANHSSLLSPGTDADGNRVKYENQARNWILRSPVQSTAHSLYGVDTSGNFYSWEANPANSNNTMAPAFCIV